MKPLYWSSLTFVLGLFISLSGCSDIGVSEEVVEDAYQDAKQLLQSHEESSPIITYEGMWISSKVYDETEMIETPDFLNRQITLSSWQPVSLVEYAKRISKLSGVSVRFAPDLLDLRGSNQRLPLDPTQGILEDLANQDITNPMMMKVPLRHSGSMKQLFDTIAARFNVFWRHEEDGIWLFLLDTQTFTLHLPGEVETSADFRGELKSSSGGGGGGIPQVATTSTTMKASHGKFEDYAKSVAALKTSLGKIEILASTGTIIVTDMPHALRRIKAFVDEQNKQLTQQVALHVKVLQVSMRDGLDFDATWGDLVARFRGKVLGSITSAGLGDLAASATLFNLTRDGSSIVFRALADKARISTVTSTSLVSLSNQPVPIQVVDEVSYVKERGSTFGGTSDLTSESVTPGTVTPGFTMTLMPKILNKGRIMLQMSIEVSTLDDLDEFAGVQLPQLSKRTVGQRVVVNSGHTLVMSGFERVNNELQEQGSGRSSFWLLGGGRTKGRARSVLLVLITPVLLS